MADKPYKLYRGGRVKGAAGQLTRKARETPGTGGDGYAATYEELKRRRWGRYVLLAVVLFLVLLAVWTALGYLAFRSGVREANERLSAQASRALAPQDGSLLSNPTTLLVLGADVGGEKGRSGRGRSDSIMLVRTDPDAHRLALVSIPRDLRVEIPGHGTDKINAAYALGGPALAVRSVEALTGLRMNHLVIVDFKTFGEVIDAVGGITVNVRKPILSNKFACPYRTPAQCQRWKGWRFRAGPQEMDGRRALIYSRIRQNRLEPGESDITRAERQQHVVQALADKVVSLTSFIRLPFIGDDLVKPLATDLTNGELLQLGWVKFRAAEDKTLRCRLGGEPANVGGVSYILGSEDNPLVIAMATGKSAPQRPPAGRPFEPGCFVGKPGS